MENAKQKADLQKLRQSIASGSGDDPGNDLMLQFHALQVSPGYRGRHRSDWCL